MNHEKDGNLTEPSEASHFPLTSNNNTGRPRDALPTVQKMMGLLFVEGEHEFSSAPLLGFVVRDSGNRGMLDEKRD